MVINFYLMVINLKLGLTNIKIGAHQLHNWCAPISKAYAEPNPAGRHPTSSFLVRYGNIFVRLA